MRRMSKLLAALLGVCLAVSVFALAGCGDETGNGNGGGASAGAWKEMLESDDFKNVTVEIITEQSMGGQTRESSATVERDGNKYRVEQEMFLYNPSEPQGTTTQVEYLEEDGGKTYIYASNSTGEKVIKAEILKADGSYYFNFGNESGNAYSSGYTMVAILNSMKQVAVDNVSKFDNGTSQSGKTVYTMSGDMMSVYLAVNGAVGGDLEDMPPDLTMTGSLKVTVSGDKVSQIEFSVNMSYTAGGNKVEMSNKMTVVFTKYGTTAVTLPAVTE